MESYFDKTDQGDFRSLLHHKIISCLSEVKSWFKEKTKGRPAPFYASFDIRDSSLKVAPVDANVFPAGFNNICEVDRERAAGLIETYLKLHYPHSKVILLLAEEHTGNFYYWDNIYIIKSLIEKGGYTVKVCVPGIKIPDKNTVESASGYQLPVSPLREETGDLIVSNNDFSTECALPEGIPCTPPQSLGWKNRRKQNFFSHYNKVAKEFAALIGINDWHFTVKTRRFAPFYLDSKENLTALKQEVRGFLSELEKERPSSWKESPFLFLKNNSGTYGLGITSISRAEEIDSWNYKTRKSMKAAKGGGGIKELIIQEGIPSALADGQGQTAEPVIYMSGTKLAGGFLRTHSKKDGKSNLNSPGAVYKRLCVSDLEIHIQGHLMENIYGWVGRLGLLALMEEMRQTADIS